MRSPVSFCKWFILKGHDVVPHDFEDLRHDRRTAHGVLERPPDEVLIISVPEHQESAGAVHVGLNHDVAACHFLLPLHFGFLAINLLFPDMYSSYR